MSDDAPLNWVRGRALSDAREVFKELASIVERDVKEANSWIADRSFDYEMDLQCDPPFILVRENNTEPVRQVRIEIGIHDQIIVREDRIRFATKPTWDGKKRRIPVDRDNPDVELWEISQKSLQKLFFPETPRPANDEPS